MRIACVLIPRFPLAIELLEQPALRGRPVVIGGAPEERKTVVACSPEAEREGIRRGMPLREARSRCREAVFLDARPGLYHDQFQRMLDGLDTISPSVEPATLGGAYLGLTGLTPNAHSHVRQPLFSSEEKLADATTAAIQGSVGLSPRIGIAETRFAAWAAAVRTTPEAAYVLRPGSAQQFLATLPLSYLPLSEEMRRRLRLLGLRTIGDLTDLPHGSVVAQFGAEGARAWDLAHGEGDTQLVARRQPVLVREQLAFPLPVADVQSILVAARHLLARLLTRPESTGRSVRGLAFSLTLSNGHRWDRDLTFREPVWESGRILRALAAKLDGITLPAAAETLTLTLRDLCAESGVQGSLFTARGRQEQELDAALQQLGARFNRPLVMTIVEVEPWSRLPERRHALAPTRAA